MCDDMVRHSLREVMESRAGGGGISTAYPINNPSTYGLGIFDFNGFALMEAAAAADQVHGDFSFGTDLLQGTGSPIIPLNSLSSGSPLQAGWNLGATDYLCTSDYLPAKSEAFQPAPALPILHGAVDQQLKRNEIHDNNFSAAFAQAPQGTVQGSVFQCLRGLETPISEPNVYGRNAGTSVRGNSGDTKFSPEQNYDGSSDEFDNLDDDDKSSKSSQYGRSAESKTLMSERKRRGRLNEKLYTLRSLVPKITKMDKASIVGDAISYVQELQKQVKDIQAEIQGLRCNSNNRNDSIPRDRDNSAVSGLNNEMLLYSEGSTSHAHPPPPLPNKTPTPQKLDLDVTKVEDRTFHIRLYCKKSPRVLIRLMRALESLELDFHNANLTSFDGHIIKTATVKIKKRYGLMEADAVRRAILDATSQHGFMTT